MTEDREKLGTYLLFLFWWAALVLIGELVSLFDSSFTLWHWVKGNSFNPLVSFGKK